MSDEPKCSYCKGACYRNGQPIPEVVFCCSECEREYDACKLMYPDAEDPVEAYWGDISGARWPDAQARECGEMRAKERR